MIVELETVGRECLFVETKLRKCRSGEVSLIGEVVNGVDDLRAVEERIVLILTLEQRRYEAALPVVAMNDVRLPAKPLAELDRRLRVHQEALVVVGVIFAGRGIDIEPQALEILFTFQHVHLNARLLRQDRATLDVCDERFIADLKIDALQPIDEMRSEERRVGKE